MTLRIEGRYLRLKRATDIVLTVIALIPLSVVMLVTAIIIRLDSPGPAIYRQTRYGVNGTKFTFYKFRSMYQNVASDVHEKATATFMDGAGELNRDDKNMPYKLGDDSRVTRVGRFIRKTSIDELPQLWNILKGDMSIVGPRPPVEYEVRRYSARTFPAPGGQAWPDGYLAGVWARTGDVRRDDRPRHQLPGDAIAALRPQADGSDRPGHDYRQRRGVKDCVFLS